MFVDAEWIKIAIQNKVETEELLADDVTAGVLLTWRW